MSFVKSIYRTSVQTNKTHSWCSSGKQCVCCRAINVYIIGFIITWKGSCVIVFNSEVILGFSKENFVRTLQFSFSDLTHFQWKEKSCCHMKCAFLISPIWSTCLGSQVHLEYITRDTRVVTFMEDQVPPTSIDAAR
jgi:hypothetical protein